MRWLWLALILSTAACDRPRVLSRTDEAATDNQAANGPLIGLSDAKSLISSLVTARTAGLPGGLVSLYSDSAVILRWQGDSSWTYRPSRWATEVVQRKGVTAVVDVHVLGLNDHRRIVATLDRTTDSTTERTLLLVKPLRVAGRWLIDLEAEIDALDLKEAALSSYSAPLIADLSYRSDPEIAILRLSGTSTTHPSLRLQDLRAGTCPVGACSASLRVDLLTISTDGNKRVDTRLENHDADCAKLPDVRLAGAVRVFERDALVLERSAIPCASGDPLLTTSIVGVRGQLTKTLLSMSRSRVVEVAGDSLTVEHRVKSSSELKTIRFVASKERERLVFRAEAAN